MIPEEELQVTEENTDNSSLNSEEVSSEEVTQSSDAPVAANREPKNSQLAQADAVLGEEDSEEAPAEEKSEEDTASEDDANRLSEAQRNLPWYVVQTYSGYEQQVKASLEERIRAHGVEESFGDILVPQETVVELVRGQKKTSTRKFLPSYIVVQVELNDETWHLVSSTPKVTGFVGNSREPSPLAPGEVESLVAQMEGGAQKPRPKVQFEQGDSVKVIDGPFADFNGTVDEVKPDKGKLRVLISIFGRNTPVELDFVQVEKA